MSIRPLMGAGVLALAVTCGCKRGPAGRDSPPLAGAPAPVQRAVNNAYANVEARGGGPDQLHGLARELHANGFPQTAVDIYQQLDDASALTTEGQYMFAVALGATGDTEAAITRYRSLLAANPGHQPASLRLADLLVERSDYDGASAVLDAMDAVDTAAWPDDAPRRALGLAVLHAHHLRGRIAAHQDRFRDAQKHASVLFADPRTAGAAARLLMTIAARRNDEALAAEWAAHSAVHDPLPPFVDPAMDGLALRSASRDELLNQADQAIMQQDADWAQTLLRRARSLYPDDADVAAMLAAVLITSGRQAEAAVHRDRATTVPAALQPRAAAHLAAALYQSRQFEAYIPLAEHIARQHPDDAAGHHALGIARASQGDLPGAINAYERAVEIAPDNDRYLSSLARALVRNNQAGQAQPLVNALVLLRPDDPQAHLVRAQVHSALSEYDEARAACQRALEIDPGFDAAQTLLMGLTR